MKLQNHQSVEVVKCIKTYLLTLAIWEVATTFSEEGDSILFITNGTLYLFNFIIFKRQKIKIKNQLLPET